MFQKNRKERPSSLKKHTFNAMQMAKEEQRICIFMSSFGLKNSGSYDWNPKEAKQN